MKVQWMKYKTMLVVWILSLLTGWVGARETEQKTIKATDTLWRPPKKVTIVIKQEYEGESRAILEQKDVAIWLRYAGVEVVGDDALEPDGTVTVTVEGDAKGAYYGNMVAISNFRHTVAKVTVTITFAGIDGDRRESFSHTTEPPKIVMEGSYTKASDAPFKSALFPAFHEAAAFFVGIHYGIDPLLIALKDERSVGRRKAAADALGRRDIGDKRAIEPLIAALKDKEKDVRKEAVEALRMIGDERVVEPLIAALKDKEKDVRKEAAWALEHIGDDEHTVEPLIAALKDKAVKSLITALKDKDKDVRRAVVRALGGVARRRDKRTRLFIDPLDKRVVEPLIATMMDKEHDVRTSADAVLRGIDPPWTQREAARNAVPEFVEALKEGDLHLRMDAAEALGYIGDKRAVGPLIAALMDKEEYVRRVAARALGRIGDKRAVEPLISSLMDNEDVREAAAQALASICAESDVEELEKISPELTQSEAAKNAVPILIDGLGDLITWSTNKQVGALKLLGIIADRCSVEPIIRVLDSARPEIREEAAWALGRIGDKRAVEPLNAALKDREKSVREAAAEALQKIKSQKFGQN